MSELRLSTLTLPIADLGKPESMPAILSLLNIQQPTKGILDEDDDIFLGYGYLSNYFPYHARSFYDREFKNRTLNTVVLENQYLRAEFLPELGGRLWSLFDKVANRDLLLSNDTMAFGNLAVLNAWFSGGVEWNMGIIGHSPFTCEPVHTAMLHTADGTPVLRIYEFERIRRCTYQIDFWLPDDSKRLYVGVSIHNPHNTVTPMYWWSNIAVPEERTSRVIVPASANFTSTLDGVVIKETALQYDDTDVTYAVQTAMPKDYFWITRKAERKFICQVGKDGYGLCQASTSRQVGRKLFVWGQSTASKRWQTLLETGGPTQRYIELQAGLGQTQYECVPMPPNTTWRWVESYGAIQLDPETAHGEYTAAVAAADTQVCEYELETVLRGADHMKQKAEKVLFSGSPWGGLENQKRRANGNDTLCPTLEFHEVESCWTALMQNGTIGHHDPQTPPESWVLDEEFATLLSNAVQGKDADNWFAWLQLGVMRLSVGKLDEAKRCLDTSLALCETVWAYYAKSILEFQRQHIEDSLAIAKKALRVSAEHVDIVRNLLLLFVMAEKYDEALEEIERLPDAVRADSRVMLYTARALLETDHITEAETMINENGDTMVTTIREGERLATDLYRLLLDKKGLTEESVPWEWDFGF